jgi:hypothetical protein
MKNAEEKVKEILSQCSSALSLDELERRTEVPRKTLSALLYRLRRKGLVHSPGKSIFSWGLPQVQLGQTFGLGVNTWMKLSNHQITIFYGDIQKKWISNEELGYSYSSVLLVRSDGEKKYFSFDWYDRTEENDSPSKLNFARFLFLIHSYGESGIRLTILPKV